MRALGIDTRPGDLYKRAPSTSTSPWTASRFDVDVVVGHIVHAITPETWSVTFGTSPAQAWRPAPTDPDVTYPYLWDDPGVVWDDVAVWDIPADPVPFP